MTALDPLASFRLDGKVALVTGASSGLGERFARVLHAAGARVAITARRQDRLERLAAELDGSVALPADIADSDARDRMVDALLDRFGHVDVLVNNAGTTAVVPIEDEELDVFRRVVEVNLTAVWHLAKRCGAAMVAHGSGSIVNVASIVGFVSAVPIKQANYAASKGAVVSLTRELAAQWARKGVRVNALCPGWFPSEMTESMIDDEASQRYIRNNTPIPRMGEQHELDGALLLLASDAGSFITGHSLVVDGGWLAR
jgi:NAD(P)-dependent dehydrogenase (short-subunit alcohol dehydrogenase family)